MNDATWQPLKEALARWRGAGRKPSFWLRDDDAVEPTPALDRLVAVAERFDIPLGLAVIPKHARPGLARHLAEKRHVTALVHGWSHDNFAPPGAKKQELGLHRPADMVLADLGRALRRIEKLFEAQSAPLLVPPWNRIDAALPPALGALGYRGLSVFGRSKPAPLRIINTSVDIIDWHGTRGCRDPGVLVEEIVAQLDAGLADPSLPAIGLLTHHLVHDEAAWDFMLRLFEATAHDGRWHSIEELLEA
ncbi:polysaccharide deacetylase family protein [Mesorhizobium sp. LHD-90]|uniref:polysaccharide deacetylase family protein n=1 Tax=Mesorhizobium sp. LHD-90 TaxID=3071414 RepID=UPI0027E0609F|nr:polysaccharide deacetylase family protein [Mesorhizobium sp. LHD-90]MDQ6434733.1 polysaccharide deacetylase family protein [Mesorhizobium sp. LHD-90]